MAASLIDVASPKFWLAVSAGMLALTPIVRLNVRRLALAGLNLGFLGMLLGRSLLVLLAGAALLYMLLRAVANPRLRRLCIVPLLFGCGSLFLIHKLPRLADGLRVAPVNPILVAIGYSYVFLRIIDVARATWEQRHPPPRPIELINYLFPFHMLAAGPIQAWDDYLAQDLVPTPLTFQQSLSMLDRIAHGLFKKFVLALGIARVLLTHERATGWYALLEMNMTYVWLYLDFSAYSDIAVGIGGLLGVATPENFNKPYFARNATDFWERWHISFSIWIRRNIFFPLQLSLVRRTGGRFPLWCASVAIFVTFVLVGLWHGLTMPFFWMGVSYAIGLVVANLYRYWLKKRLGAKGVARYMASTPIRIAAVIVTFEFVAFTIRIIANP